MEISAQRNPARMEPCVQTALEALIVSVSRVSLEPSARKVRRRRQDFAHEHHFWFAFQVLQAFHFVFTMQTRLCALWKRTRAALSSVNQATYPTNAPAPVGGSSTQTRNSVCLKVRLSCIEITFFCMFFVRVWKKKSVFYACVYYLLNNMADY